MCADRAADLAHANALSRLDESLFSAAEFIEHQRQFEAKRDWFGVDAVAATDHRRHFVSPRLLRDRRRVVRFESSSKIADDSVS